MSKHTAGNNGVRAGERETPLAIIVAALTISLVAAIAWLLWRVPSGLEAGHASFLPSLNASLNGATTVCLLFGWRAIRRRQVSRHRAWMVTAVVLSAAFLVSYVVHHYQVGSVRFTGPDWLRLLYLVILVPHIVLSAVMVPFVLLTLTRALQGNFVAHRRVARRTLPIWLVVSVTGVLVYWLLYHVGSATQDKAAKVGRPPHEIARSLPIEAIVRKFGAANECRPEP